MIGNKIMNEDLAKNDISMLIYYVAWYKTIS